MLAGIEVAPPDHRGTIVLVVEDTYNLSSQITTLTVSTAINVDWSINHTLVGSHRRWMDRSSGICE